MNFLAHAYLSGTNKKILVGNFIGDFVKGKQSIKTFDPDIAKGIELHRAIDAFTDGHPIVHRSKNRLRPKYRHYSAVIVDVFYDHLLAVKWKEYKTDDLSGFATYVYNTVATFDEILPEGFRYMLPYMISGNWLYNYSTMSGIHKALSGMAHRTPFDSKMNEAINDLREYYDLFETEFDEFFPLLEKHCKQFLA